MIENPVNDYPDSKRMRFLYQFPKFFIRSQIRRYMAVIQNIVLVVFPRCEDWIDVDTVKAQIMNIIQIFRYPLQFSPEPGLKHNSILPWSFIRRAADASFIRGKTVRENIVDNSMFQPIRN